jgi:hypothetical protein
MRRGYKSTHHVLLTEDHGGFERELTFIDFWWIGRSMARSLFVFYELPIPHRSAGRTGGREVLVPTRETNPNDSPRLENKSISADPKPGNNRVSPVCPCEGRGRDRSASLKFPRAGFASDRAEKAFLFQRTLRAHATTGKKKLPGLPARSPAPSRVGEGKGRGPDTKRSPLRREERRPARSAAAGNAKTTILSRSEGAVGRRSSWAGFFRDRPCRARRGGARAVFPILKRLGSFGVFSTGPVSCGTTFRSFRVFPLKRLRRAGSPSAVRNADGSVLSPSLLLMMHGKAALLASLFPPATLL